MRLLYLSKLQDARGHAILGKAFWNKGALIRTEQSLQQAVELASNNQRYLEDIHKLREQLNR